jgi:hypothetical protein
MSASTWAGLDRLPAHLDGYGAITSETGLMLVRSAGTISAALLDPASGAVIDVGARVYRPRQSVRDVATGRAETCRFPSCRQPSWRCDLDHREAFDHDRPHLGGGTTPDNLDPLCRPHHLLKHHGGWSSTPVDGLGREWVSPTRHHYLDPARSLTLPGELLTPIPPTTSTRPAAHQDRPDDQPGSPDTPNTAVAESGAGANEDPPAPTRSHTDADNDAEDADRDDWRDAEFGGAFPDTATLKILHGIASRRIQALREPPSTDHATTAERLAAIATLHQHDDTASPTHPDGPTNPTSTLPNTTDPGRLDPHEPPF